MHEFVVELGQLANAPRARASVGGKALELARLWAAGLPVPPALVVPAEARALPAEQKARLLAYLRERAAALGEVLAVRSSAALEDDVAAAAPGVFASVLHVRPDDLERAVERVWASADTPLVREYARLRGVQELAIAVIVQQQVPSASTAATAAGTLYTRTPGRPESADMLLEIRFRGDRAPDAPDAQVRGIRLARAPADRDVGQGMGSLDAAAVNRLCELALAAERAIAAEERGADVEWVVHEGDCWLVQARRIVHPVARAAAERSDMPALLLAFSRAQPDVIWRWDVTHNPDPLSPAQAGLVERVDEAGLAPYRMRVVGGYLYIADAVASESEVRAEPAGELEVPAEPLDADALRRYFDQVIVPAMAAALAPVSGERPDVPSALAAYERLYAIYARRWTPVLGRGKRALAEFLREHAVPGAEETTGPERLAFELTATEQPAGLSGLLAQAARGRISRATLLAEIGALAPAWDVACPTLAETPDLPDRIERALREHEQASASHGDSDTWARAETRARSVRERLPSALVQEFDRRLALARCAHAIAEMDDLWFARAQAAVRRALLAQAEIWQLSPPQICYLPLAEVLAWRAHPHPPDAARLERLARAGRASVERQRAWLPPLAFAGGAPLAVDRNSAAGPGWSGYGAGGRARGACVRVDRLDGAAPEVAGAIVVTRTVTPAMVVWLRGAAAMVAEHGGLLDHGAAMARELGIPCVVGCRGIWSDVRTGDPLWVDGDAGRVMRSRSPTEDGSQDPVQAADISP